MAKALFLMSYKTGRRRSFSLAEEPAWKTPVMIFVGLAVLGGVFFYLRVNPVEALLALPEFVLFFSQNFWPPDFKNITSHIPLIVDTILFAVVATYLSAVLSFIFGLLLSEKTNRIAWIRLIIRFLVSFLRNVPVLVWAALLVYIFGIGHTVGLIALVFATLGFLSRSYAESIDEVAGAKLEALKACGGSYFQILFHGLLPEFIPAWVNWTLYSFEINIRASVILGMVGAGGIGIMILTKIRQFQYQEALSLIIVLVGMTLSTELFTNKIRKSVR